MINWLHIYDITNSHFAINLNNVFMVTECYVTENEASVCFHFVGNDTGITINVILDTYIQIMEAIGGDLTPDKDINCHN